MRYEITLNFKSAYGIRKMFRFFYIIRNRRLQINQSLISREKTKPEYHSNTYQFLSLSKNLTKIKER
jgi:hypothetical protein